MLTVRHHLAAAPPPGGDSAISAATVAGPSPPQPGPQGTAGMRRPQKVRSPPARPGAIRGITAGAFALAAAVTAMAGAGAFHPAKANAQATTTQLPYMCFNTSHTFHQIFGPNSFFLNENQQALTSFSEAPPTSKPLPPF